MAKNCWLVKQEPEDYPWTTFVKERGTAWTGVRNFQARNNLRAMKKGDWVFYYHSGEAKQVVGLGRVAREHYPDPTAEAGDWVAVDLAPVRPLIRPVGLHQIKADPILRSTALVQQSRLSVTPVTLEEFRQFLELAETSVPQPLR